MHYSKSERLTENENKFRRSKKYPQFIIAKVEKRMLYEESAMRFWCSIYIDGIGNRNCYNSCLAKI